MKEHDCQLPEPVRLRAQAQGESGLDWMAGLGACVASLEAEWSIRVGSVLAGGSESLLLEAWCADGSAAILKIGLPGSADLATEAKVYRLAHGRGYATLIAHDGARNALLLERLGKPLAELGITVRQQIEAICATLQEAWIPLDGACNLMTGTQKATWLAAFIAETWRALEKPCDAKIIERALSFAQERKAAFSPSNSVLVHGDAHAHNTLVVPNQTPDEAVRYKFVDPDGLCAERAYDLAIPMRGWNRELLAGDALLRGWERCALLSELTDVDQRAICQWGFIERVSTGLALLQIGMQDEGVETLAVADLWRNG